MFSFLSVEALGARVGAILPSVIVGAMRHHEAAHDTGLGYVHEDGDRAGL